MQMGRAAPAEVHWLMRSCPNGLPEIHVNRYETSQNLRRTQLQRASAVTDRDQACMNRSRHLDGLAGLDAERERQLLEARLELAHAVLQHLPPLPAAQGRHCRRGLLGCRYGSACAGKSHLQRCTPPLHGYQHQATAHISLHFIDMSAMTRPLPVVQRRQAERGPQAWARDHPHLEISSELATDTL